MKENGNNGLRAKTGQLFNKLRLAGEPIWYLKTSGSAFQRAGVADYLVIYDGRAGALELKSPGERPTPPQEHELRWVAKAHGLAGWADSIEGVRAFCDTIRNPIAYNTTVLRSLGGELVHFE
jgi:hypothetical protein